VTVYLYGLPKDYLETYQARVTAVTPADVGSAAKVLLAPGDAVIAVVGDWTKVKDQLTGYGEITFLDPEGRTLSTPPSD
jgi:predicted Zn-dependent peptidase